MDLNKVLHPLDGFKLLIQVNHLHLRLTSYHVQRQTARLFLLSRTTRSAGGRCFRPVQQAHQLPARIPFLQAVIQYAAGQLRRDSRTSATWATAGLLEVTV